MKRKPTLPTPSICSPAKPQPVHQYSGSKQATVTTCCGASARTTMRKGRVIHICKGCHYNTSVQLKIVFANLIPAYGRRPVTAAEVLDYFYRGFDYDISPAGVHTSIRDMAPGALVQFRYGKRLQKSLAHEVDLSLKR